MLMGLAFVEKMAAVAVLVAAACSGSRAPSPPQAQSAAGASETTRAVRDLVDLAEQLTSAIARFRLERDSPRR